MDGLVIDYHNPFLYVGGFAALSLDVNSIFISVLFLKHLLCLQKQYIFVKSDKAANPPTYKKGLW